MKALPRRPEFRAAERAKCQAYLTSSYRFLSNPVLVSLFSRSLFRCFAFENLEAFSSFRFHFPSIPTSLFSCRVFATQRQPTQKRAPNALVSFSSTGEQPRESGLVHRTPCNPLTRWRIQLSCRSNARQGSPPSALEGRASMRLQRLLVPG